MGTKPLTPERARELTAQLDTALRESAALRAEFENYRRRPNRVPWPNRPEHLDTTTALPAGEDCEGHDAA